ncbi:hypothetical protein Aspvir_001077 [Aspergillus viridinutans]|uniref:Ornithine decarboxylase antizyme n=1 Tax=Aspergillus viridinutans TaxID=75553 RepID=A0A9P3BSS7_ASPVI|nr:uncharacterized protein Aspvir_001077 [Aspergillus viridinutans]GIJ98955.1 hypothetical protein Aspvir_001077 [Aspergillus viridinutans]
MAKSINNQSSNSNQLQRSFGITSQPSVLASCYSVDALTSMVSGFHYCTTTGAGKICPLLKSNILHHDEHSGIPEVPSGSKTPSSSPPRSLPVPSPLGSSWPGNQLPEYKGEATYTIPEECERLFCDKLRAIFIGEMKFAQQESPGMDACQSRPNWTSREKRPIRNWVEVWDYVGDAIYRGFLTDMDDERTLFLFFKDSVLGHNLKAGLIALFELANMPMFECSQIVACIPRSQEVTDSEIVRNLGWCGFNLTTLKSWIPEQCVELCLSTKWLFLCAEV